jgi:uncharacterized lipoprotein YmbA
MGHISIRWAVFVFGLSFIASAGCLNLGEGTQEATKFYVLSPLSTSEVKTEVLGGTKPVAIGLGPVTFPEYLNRPQVVVREGNNQLQIAKFARWAEPLRENFSRVLAENLAVLLSTDNIVPYPRKQVTPMNYQVTVDIIRFDGIPGEGASLVARWTILGDDGKKLLWVEKSSFTQATGGRSYEKLVSAQSRLVGILSGQIADAIKNLSRMPL